MRASTKMGGGSGGIGGGAGGGGGSGDNNAAGSSSNTRIERLLFKVKVMRITSVSAALLATVVCLAAAGFQFFARTLPLSYCLYYAITLGVGVFSLQLTYYALGVVSRDDKAPSDGAPRGGSFTGGGGPGSSTAEHHLFGMGASGSLVSPVAAAVTRASQRASRLFASSTNATSSTAAALSPPPPGAGGATPHNNDDGDANEARKRPVIPEQP